MRETTLIVINSGEIITVVIDGKQYKAQIL